MMIEDLMPFPQPDPLTLELTAESSAASIEARSVSKMRENDTDPTTSVHEPESRTIPRDREASLASDSNARTDSSASVHESRRPDRLPLRRSPLRRQTEKRRRPLGLVLPSTGVQSMSTDNNADSTVNVRESKTRPIALGKRKREAFMASTFLGSWIGIKMKKWRKNEALPDDLKTEMSLDDDLVSSPKEALSQFSADRKNKHPSRSLVSIEEASTHATFDIEAQNVDYPVPTISLSPNATSSSNSPRAARRSSLLIDSNTPPTFPDGSNPVSPRIWTVIHASGLVENPENQETTATLEDSQVIEECGLSILERTIIQDNDMLHHPPYICLDSTILL
ncbi:hypothetical protein OROGR_009935 [Orobanche gracilis]